MTTVVPFGTATSTLPLPSFVRPNPTLSIQKIARTVLKSKRVAVICGAGISTGSGIPDFRSTEGLFATLKAQYPEAKLTSGKDLFDASLFSSEENVAIFYTMIAKLKEMVEEAEPSPFHEFLKELDEEGKLFRVYTQNIDGLEEKVGLSYGLGERAAVTGRGRTPSQASLVTPTRTSTRKRKATFDLPLPPPPPIFIPITPTKPSTSSEEEMNSNCSSPLTSLASSPRNSPPPEIRNPPTPSKVKDKSGIPRCIPLHGTLSSLYCPHCSHVVSIGPYLETLAGGSSSSCPACVSLDEERREKGERSRGIGRLKPDVVLYNEIHKAGERVGEITRKDLMGARPDLLLVVGTSLKVPGTKLLVREFSKVIRPVPLEEEEEEEGEGREKMKPVHIIYLNLEFPTSTKEWQGVFDIWAQGDVQEFIQVIELEKEKMKEELKEKLWTKEMKGRKALLPKLSTVRKVEKRVTKRKGKGIIVVVEEAKGKIKSSSGALLPRTNRDKVETISNVFNSTKAGKGKGKAE